MIMYPENQYSDLVEVNLKKLNLNNYKKFKYNPDPEVLTGEIETLTIILKKKNLELKKMFEDKEDPQSVKQLRNLNNYIH